MKVTEIRTPGALAIEAIPFKPELAPKKELSDLQKDKVQLSSSPINWQKDILLSALDMLENKIKNDDGFPLDKLENRPIETFEEALKELAFLRTNKFRNEASAAQANINPADVVSLFLEEAA